MAMTTLCAENLISALDAKSPPSKLRGMFQNRQPMPMAKVSALIQAPIMLPNGYEFINPKASVGMYQNQNQNLSSQYQH